MERDTVLAWVGAYEDAWRDDDRDAVAALFTEDAHYRVSPYARDMIGHASIQAFWLVDEGETFTMTAEPVAIEGDTAVVRVHVHYLEPRPQEYRDLWVLRFAGDGRVVEFEEWPFWPGQPHTAGD